MPLRKYPPDSWLTEVMKPDGRQYTLKPGKVLVEAIAAGIEPLEFRRKKTEDAISILQRMILMHGLTKLPSSYESKV